MDRRARLRDARLYFVADRGGMQRALEGALAGGVDLFQLRDKDATDDELLAAAATARELLRRRRRALPAQRPPRPRGRQRRRRRARRPGRHAGRPRAQARRRRRDRRALDALDAAGPGRLPHRRGLHRRRARPRHADQGGPAGDRRRADQVRRRARVGPVVRHRRPRRRHGRRGGQGGRAADRRRPRDRPGGRPRGGGARAARGDHDAGRPEPSVAAGRGPGWPAEAPPRGRRSRKRRPGAGPPVAAAPPPEPVQADRMRRGYARAEERNAAVRAQLEPLGPGERPRPLVVAAALAAAAGGRQRRRAGRPASTSRASSPARSASLLFAALMLLAAVGGCGERRYWAVLGFEALLGITSSASRLFAARRLQRAAVVVCVRDLCGRPAGCSGSSSA